MFESDKVRDEAVEPDLPTFQDLYIRSANEPRSCIRKALVKHAAPPWSHDHERENDLAAHAGPDADVIAFMRQRDDDVDAVGLILWSHVDGYEVTNIVPREVGQLGYQRYNAALQDFVTRVVEPAASAAQFEVRITSAAQGLNDWLPPAAADALRRFSRGANKSTGSSHPSDQKRWLAFLLQAHLDVGSFDADRLLRWLTEVEGWPEDKAQDLAIQYEFGLALLEEYERTKA
jgi:hypothetical protein